MLDEQLDKLGKPGLLNQLVETRTKKKLSAETAAKIADKDAMFRRVLSTVLITQAFRELPVETQVEPTVQNRMWRHYDQIGATIFEISDMLASLDPKERVRVRTTLQEQPDLAMELGEQLDVRNITRDEQAGELSAEQVAGYIAKYATKATESFGAGLNRRLGAGDLEHLDSLPAHVAELVRAAWALGGRPELEGLRRKLENTQFVERARPDVVAQSRQRVAELEERLRRIREMLGLLGAA